MKGARDLSTGAKIHALSRRRLLQFGGGLALTLCPLARAQAAQSQERLLALHNIHTGERLQRVYWAAGDYIPDSLAEIDLVLRDWRTDDVHPMEPQLLDLLHQLHGVMGSDEPFEVISGYRSPKTNATLASASSGVAKKSLHMRGMAIDIHLPGRRLADLRDAAWGLQQGGVGYYQKSGFIHLDIGRVRRW